AGLYAQTSMRIEKGFCAMGHELDGDTTPAEAGLDFAVRKSGGFIGAEALAQRRIEGETSKIFSVRFDDPTAVPLGNEPVRRHGEIIGLTTSAAFGYRVGRPVALARSALEVVAGERVEVDIARTRFGAETVRGALFDPNGHRMRKAGGV
ncbi:MAG: glycine cleavage T C-terminal barrel domain-containing protein, partial [Pseudomonadota bacterium]